LNFGHTFGHAIEQCQGYGEWLHGEAVAAGMVMASMLSDISKEDVARLIDLLRRAGLPVKPPAIGAGAMQEAMRMDKKVLGKQLRFVLLRQLGDAFVSADYDPDRLSLTLEVVG
jgi:3-dehydroquinate synthase